MDIKNIVQVNDQTKIDVQLQVSSESLDEVVFISYGKTTVKELTGATVKVKGESVERLNIPRMDQALQGQVSGVAINTNLDLPEDHRVLELEVYQPLETMIH